MIIYAKPPRIEPQPSNIKTGKLKVVKRVDKDSLPTVQEVSTAPKITTHQVENWVAESLCSIAEKRANDDKLLQQWKNS